MINIKLHPPTNRAIKDYILRLLSTRSDMCIKAANGGHRSRVKAVFDGNRIIHTTTQSMVIAAEEIYHSATLVIPNLAPIHGGQFRALEHARKGCKADARLGETKLMRNHRVRLALHAEPRVLINVWWFEDHDKTPPVCCYKCICIDRRGCNFATKRTLRRAQIH